MTATSEKIIFFGTETDSRSSLQALIDSSYNIVAVVTKPDFRKGRGLRLSKPPVKTLAKEHGIPVWQPSRLRDITDDIAALQPVAGVLVAYGKIIPQSIIDLFTPGIINLHPSLLPLYRGPSPIEAAILNRDQLTGVSIMQLEAGMDSGPVYLQESIELTGSETKADLYQRLFNLGNQLLVDNLADIITGKLQPSPQDHSQASYCPLLTKDMSWIDPEQQNASEALAHIRAFEGFPRSRYSLYGHDIIITQAHISEPSNKDLAISCHDDKHLIIDELIAPSGKAMSGEAFLRGYAPRRGENNYS